MEDAEIQKKLQEIQIRANGKAMNKITRDCFNDCVEHFRSRSLQDDEKQCLRRCLEKRVVVTQRVVQRFQDFNLQKATELNERTEN